MTTTRTNLLATALGLGLAAALAGWTPYGDIADLPTDSMPACTTEGAPGPCHWDATTRGNGQGTSFTVHADQTITYGK